jgi:hypothetical protein
MATRDYTSRRISIVKALTAKLAEINGSGDYRTTVASTYPKLVFWDEINEFPSINVSAGPETRQYQGGGYKDRLMSVTIRCYVNEEDPQLALEALLEDVETVIELNSRLAYTDSLGATQYTQQMTVNSLDTDEGALAPLGVGELQIEVRY